MEPVGYRSIEHTADLAYELWGPTEGDVLLAGMRAVIDELTDGAAVDATEERVMDLRALDPGDRLIRWLNEVLHLAQVEGFVVSDADLVLGEGSLRASLRGQADARHLLQTEIKSATYHDLQLSHDPDGQWRARVVMDV